MGDYRLARSRQGVRGHRAPPQSLAFQPVARLFAVAQLLAAEVLRLAFLHHAVLSQRSRVLDCIDTQVVVPCEAKLTTWPATARSSKITAKQCGLVAGRHPEFISTFHGGV